MKIFPEKIAIKTPKITGSFSPSHDFILFRDPWTAESGDRAVRIGPKFSKFCWSWFGPVLDFEIIFEISQIFSVLIRAGPRFLTGFGPWIPVDSFETNMDFTNWIQVNKNENSFTLDSLLPNTKYLMEARFVETKPKSEPEVEPEIESEPEVDQKQNPDWEPKYSESELLEFQTEKITVPKVANPFITSVTYGRATIIWDEPKTDLEIDGYIILYGPEDSPSYIKKGFTLDGYRYFIITIAISHQIVILIALCSTI